MRGLTYGVPSHVLKFPRAGLLATLEVERVIHPALERGWALREYGKILLRDAQIAVRRSSQLVAESRRLKIRLHRYGND
jgi:hypothetical protein